MQRGRVELDPRGFRANDPSHFLITKAHVELFQRQWNSLPRDGFVTAVNKRVAQKEEALKSRSLREALAIVERYSAKIDRHYGVSARLILKGSTSQEFKIEATSSLAKDARLDRIVAEANETLKKTLSELDRKYDELKDKVDKSYGRAVQEEAESMRNSAKLLELLRSVNHRKLYAAPGVDVGGGIRQRLLGTANFQSELGRLEPEIFKPKYERAIDAAKDARRVVEEVYSRVNPKLVDAVIEARRKMEEFGEMAVQGETGEVARMRQQIQNMLSRRAQEAARILQQHMIEVAGPDALAVIREFEKEYGKQKVYLTSTNEDRLMFFSGKYKGKSIYSNEIPIEYLLWIDDSPIIKAYRVTERAKITNKKTGESKEGGAIYQRGKGGAVRLIGIVVGDKEYLLQDWDKIKHLYKVDASNKQRKKFRQNNEEVELGTVKFGGKIGPAVHQYLRSSEGRRRIREYEAEQLRRDKDQVREGFNPAIHAQEENIRRRGFRSKNDPVAEKIPVDLQYHSERKGGHPALNETDSKDRGLEDRILGYEQDTKRSTLLANELKKIKGMPGGLKAFVNSERGGALGLVHSIEDDIWEHALRMSGKQGLPGGDREMARLLRVRHSILMQVQVYDELLRRVTPEDGGVMNSQAARMLSAANKIISRFDPGWRPESASWYLPDKFKNYNPDLLDEPSGGWSSVFSQVSEELSNLNPKTKHDDEWDEDRQETFEMRWQELRRRIEDVLDPRLALNPQVAMHMLENPDHPMLEWVETLYTQLSEIWEENQFQVENMGAGQDRMAKARREHKPSDWFQGKWVDRSIEEDPIQFEETFLGQDPEMKTLYDHEKFQQVLQSIEARKKSSPTRTDLAMGPDVDVGYADPRDADTFNSPDAGLPGVRGEENEYQKLSLEEQKQKLYRYMMENPEQQSIFQEDRPTYEELASGSYVFPSVPEEYETGPIDVPDPGTKKNTGVNPYPER